MKNQTTENYAHTLSDRAGAAASAIAELPPCPAGIVERHALKDLAELIHRRALIAVAGPGGVGKTTAVIRWFNDAHQNTNPKMLVWLRAQSLATAPIAATLRRHMGFPDSISDWMPSDKTALERLTTANPNSAHPLLLLALDAADEPAKEANWQEHVSSLLRHFAASDSRALAGELPVATLIVTCRTPKDLRRFWLLDETQNPARGDAFAVVAVERFSEEELSDAAAYVSESVRARIIEGLLGRRHDLPEVLGGVASGSLSAEDPAWRKHLSHPALWGVFRSLAEEVQHGVLNAEEAALHALAHDFIELFCIKVRNRKRNGDQTIDDLGETLHRIADKADSGVAHEQRMWESEAAAAGNRSPSALYSEAIGYGLVAQVENRYWRWEHEFVQRFLASH